MDLINSLRIEYQIILYDQSWGGGGAHIEEKIRQYRLWLFRHVQRHLSASVVKKYAMQFYHCMKNGPGRPKRTWMEIIKKDMEKLEPCIQMVYERTK